MTELKSLGISPGTHDPDGLGETPDGGRRRLLRAAAAAPLLATIPTGAALANTSAFQCVVTSKAASDGCVPTMATTNTADKWIRRPAKFLRFTRSKPAAVWFGFSLDVNAGSDAARTWYDQNGNQLSPTFVTPCGETEICPLGTSTNTNVLAIFEPKPDGTAPTSVVLKGYYSQQSTECNRSSQVGNIGLYASCYASVAPTITATDALQRALMETYAQV